MTFMNLAKDMARLKQSPSKFVMIAASSGMGKTTLVAHAMEHIRKMMNLSSRKFLIARHVAKTSETMTPYSTIRALFRKVLTGYGRASDEGSVGSEQLPDADQWEDESVSYESIMGHTVASSTVMTNSKIDDLFDGLCDELDAAPAVCNHVRRLLISPDGGEDTAVVPGRFKRKTPSLRTTVSFIRKAFEACMDDASLVCFAVDDVHVMDEMSWRVLQELFQTSVNLMIVGTSYTMSSATLRVSDFFWDELHDKYTKSGQFHTMELECLNKDEVLTMTMKSLGLSRQEVTAALLNEVFVQSGGMPHFAKEILEGIKSRCTPGVCPDVNAAHTESVAEIVLTRIDSLDITVRNLLNVGAILGMSFRLGEILEVLKDNETSDEDLRTQTVESLHTGVVEGIIDFDEQEGLSEAESKAAFESDDAVFSFHLETWRNTLLGLMLDSRKRTVNKKIAHTMENRMKTEAVSIEFRKRICGHWKEAGDTTKATSTALSIGKTLEDDLGRAADSIDLYEEMLQLWGWDKGDDESIAGFTVQVLELIGVPDLKNIVSLMIAYGRAHGRIFKHTDMVSAYEDSLRIFLIAKSSEKVQDRSIVFPAFIGLSRAIGDGHLEQDKSCRYEQAMLRRFLEETRNHGRLIHHIHALYMQFQLHAKLGYLDKALAVQSVIKSLYKPERHSKGLRRSYGLDSGALSASFGSYFQLALGRNKQSLKQCRSTLKEIVPKIELDFRQSFSMMYPLTLVLMGTGYGTEGRSFFEKVVIQAFGQPEGPSFYLGAIYQPLLMLLDLTGRRKVKKEKLAEYLAWAVAADRCRFGEVVNLHLGRLGRCGDSISAEIYTLLAASVPEGRLRNTLLTHAKALCEEAMAFNKKHRLRVAQEIVRVVEGKMEVLRGAPNS